MRTAIGIGMLLAVLGLASSSSAAALDGSVPILCAIASVTECSSGRDCERQTAEGAEVPPFIWVNVQQRLLKSPDGARTSPITAVERADGRLMLQGMQNGRVWGAVIDERTGKMFGAISEADGGFVLSGACLVP
jgi:hypothetical protein